VSGQLHIPATLFPGMEPPQYPPNKKLDGPHLPQIKQQYLRCPAHSLVTTLPYRRIVTLYASPNTVCAVKSRRMKWMQYSTNGETMKCIQIFGSKMSRKEMVWETQKNIYQFIITLLEIIIHFVAKPTEQ
jgi:hypothetical protein